MSPEEYAEFLRGKIEELRKNNRPFGLAVATSVAQVSKRAFTDKRNEKGESFQYNSTDPVYIRDEDSPRKLSHKGKNGSDTYKSGKKKGQKHTTTYFDSYKSFRGAVGRDTDAVDWQLTNDLRSDYGNSSKAAPVSQLKPAVQINVNNYITRLTRDNNVKKYGGLSARYGEFLTCSTKEEADFFRINELELGKFLSE